MNFLFRPNIRGLLSAASLLVLTLSCNKDNSPGINSQTSSLTQTLAYGNNTTIFYSAVQKAGLDSVFSGPAIFTLLVPNDLACTQSGYPQSVIDGFTREQARQWVLYQTYAGGILTAESFIGKTEEKIIMANGDSVFISGDSNRTYVNGNEMTNSELLANNGVMLAQQYVVLPPTMNLEQMIANDTSLSFLYQAVQLASPVPDTLSNVLSTGGPFTLLAPDNDAFRSAGYSSPADLDTANPDNLRNLILLGMIPTRLFSYDVGDSSTYQSLADSTLIIYILGLERSVQVLGSSNSAGFVSVNQMAINGVMFKIDSLLSR